jgi:2-polyprenyl-3-methyl-5-hydroxy-6-metoxy-1,4-benzoquinol methylase
MAMTAKPVDAAATACQASPGPPASVALSAAAQAEAGGRGKGLALLCPECRGDLHAASDGMRCPACGRAYPETDGILSLLAGRMSAPGFDPHYFQSLARIEDRHFWFVARRRLILEVLRRYVPDLGARRLFDIGCGSGGLLSFLAASGVPLLGACDAYLESLHIVRRRVSTALLQVDEGRLPPVGGGLGLVSLFDVLEHLDDDSGTLAWLASVMEPGGVVVLTVPAHPFLFDEMDVIAHHRQRYRQGELKQKLEAAGFRVRYLTHFMAPLVPALVMWRWLAKLAGAPKGALTRRETEFRVVPVLNGALGLLLGMERFLALRSPLPFGSSLIAVASKPD